MKSKCRVAALAREYDVLTELSFSGVSQAFYDKILETMDAIRAVASYLPARSAKGRAFHRWLIELEVDDLGEGIIDRRVQRDAADAVLRMNGSAYLIKHRKHLLAVA
jgi:hypothetical protein